MWRQEKQQSKGATHWPSTEPPTNVLNVLTRKGGEGETPACDRTGPGHASRHEERRPGAEEQKPTVAMHGPCGGHCPSQKPMHGATWLCVPTQPQQVGAHDSQERLKPKPPAGARHYRQAGILMPTCVCGGCSTNPTKSCLWLVPPLHYCLAGGSCSLPAPKYPFSRWVVCGAWLGHCDPVYINPWKQAPATQTVQQSSPVAA